MNGNWMSQPSEHLVIVTAGINRHALEDRSGYNLKKSTFPHILKLNP